jgi:hydroxymethylbilane synthase
MVADVLTAHGWRVELVTIRTVGDDHGPDAAWGEGAFVTALERALRSAAIDLAIHSAKDIPVAQPSDLRIGAILPRADPRDALVTRAAGGRLVDLPDGARVGTDSPRRSGFLRRSRPDLRPHPLSGNVDRRLARLEAGETDALVLAVAGLERLGRMDRIGEILDPKVVPPAAGQGAIAVQCRTGDATVDVALAALDDRQTHQAVLAERAFLSAAGGGCRAPMGVLARHEGERLVLLGGQVEIDGSRAWLDQVDGPPDDAERLGTALAERIARARVGAGADPRRPSGPSEDVDGAGPAPTTRPTVMVTRASKQARSLVAALEAVGIRAIEVPAIRARSLETDPDLLRAAERVASYDRVVVVSPNGASALLSACARAGTDPSDARWAAVGPATADRLREAGALEIWTAGSASAASLAEELPMRQGDRVLVVRGDRSGAEPVATLERRGAQVETVLAYRTEEAPPASRRRLRLALADGPPDAICFTSGSTVRGLVRLAGPAAGSLVGRPALCIGRSTAAEARAHGFTDIRVAPSASAAALATLAAEVIAR